MNTLSKKQSCFVRKIISGFVGMTFLCQSVLPVYAQGNFVLPAVGSQVALSQAFTPAMLRAVKVNLENPFEFDFIVDQGSAKLSEEQFTEESQKLIRYFLVSLTTPENDLWVNLSPYEKSRIIPESFGVTEMGRDLLAQDYLLKQITATLLYPQGEVGKKFWDKVREKALKKFGTTEVPTNTFNKVWIVPEKAVVYENGASAYVQETHLKVMLEEDYLALAKSEVSVAKSQDVNALGSQVVREIVLPELEKEVNEGTHFAPLRQVYHSLILANWYKKRMKDSILAQVYVDQKKVAGVEIDDKKEAEKIYEQYIAAFKEGVFNYIKEDYDPIRGENIPKKYFSGGMGFVSSSSLIELRSGLPKNPQDSSKMRLVSTRLEFLNNALKNSLAALSTAMALTLAPMPVSAVNEETAQIYALDQSKESMYILRGISVQKAEKVMNENLAEMLGKFKQATPEANIAQWIKDLAQDPQIKTFDDFTKNVRDVLAQEQDPIKLAVKQEEFLKAFYLFIVANAQYDHEGIKGFDYGFLSHILVGRDGKGTKRVFVCHSISVFALMLLEEFGLKDVFIINVKVLEKGKMPPPPGGHNFNLVRFADGRTVLWDGATAGNVKQLVMPYQRYNTIVVRNSENQRVAIDLYNPDGSPKDLTETLKGYRGDTKSELLNWMLFNRQAVRYLVALNPFYAAEFISNINFALARVSYQDQVQDNYSEKALAQAKYFLNHPFLNEKTSVLTASTFEIAAVRLAIADAISMIESSEGNTASTNRGVKVFLDFGKDYWKTMKAHVEQFNTARELINEQKLDQAQTALDLLGAQLPLTIKRFEQDQSTLIPQISANSERVAMSERLVDNFRELARKVEESKEEISQKRIAIATRKIYEQSRKNFDEADKRFRAQLSKIQELINDWEFPEALGALDGLFSDILKERWRLADLTDGKFAEGTMYSKHVSDFWQYLDKTANNVRIYTQIIDLVRLQKEWAALSGVRKPNKEQVSNIQRISMIAQAQSSNPSLRAAEQGVYRRIADDSKTTLMRLKNLPKVDTRQTSSAARPKAGSPLEESLVNRLRSVVTPYIVGLALAFSAIPSDAVTSATARVYADNQKIYGVNVSVERAQKVMDENLDKMFSNLKSALPPETPAWLRDIIISKNSFDDFSLAVRTVFRNESDAQRLAGLQKDFMRVLFVFIRTNMAKDLSVTRGGNLRDVIVGVDQENKRVFNSQNITEFVMNLAPEFGLTASVEAVEVITDFGGRSTRRIGGYNVVLVHYADQSASLFDPVMWEDGTDAPHKVIAVNDNGRRVKVDISNRANLARLHGDTVEDVREFTAIRAQLTRLIAEQENVVNAIVDGRYIQAIEVLTDLRDQLQRVLAHRFLSYNTALVSYELILIREYRQRLNEAVVAMNEAIATLKAKGQDPSISFESLLEEYEQIVRKTGAHFTSFDELLVKNEFSKARVILNTIKADLDQAIARFGELTRQNESLRRKLDRQIKDLNNLRQEVRGREQVLLDEVNKVLSPAKKASSVVFKREEMAVRDQVVYSVLEEAPELKRYLGGAKGLYNLKQALSYILTTGSQGSDYTVLLPEVIDDLFNRANQMAETVQSTKIVFPQAGAKPLYDASVLTAQVNAKFPVDQLKSIWATMRQYEEIKADENQAVLFVKYLVDTGVITDGVNHLLIADTDVGYDNLGTMLIFAETILNPKILNRANKDFGLNIAPFNEGEGGNTIEFRYMYSSYNDNPQKWDNHVKKAGLAPEIAAKLRVSGFNPKPGGSQLQMQISDLWGQIDLFVKSENVSDRLSMNPKTKRVSFNRIEPRNQAYLDWGILNVARAIEDAGLLMGILNVLEAQGYDVSNQVNALIAQLQEQIRTSGYARGEGDSQQQSSSALTFGLNENAIVSTVASSAAIKDRNDRANAMIDTFGLNFKRYWMGTKGLYADSRVAMHRMDNPLEDLREQVFLPKFLDAVFARALQLGDPQSTRIVFLQAGAGPLYDAAQMMAKFGEGRFPAENIKSVWATMENYKQLKADPAQAELFVKYLYDEGVLTPQTKHILIVDTDTGFNDLGTALLFAQTLLNNQVLARVNERFAQKMGFQIQSFNEGEAGNSLDFFYLHSDYIEFPDKWDGHIRDAEIPSDIEAKLKSRIVGYKQIDQVLGDYVSSFWGMVDENFVKVTSILDRLSIEPATGKVYVIKAPPYEQQYEDLAVLKLARTIQNTGFLMGLLDVLETRGYDVSQEAEKLLSELEEAFRTSGLTQASIDQSAASSSLAPGGIDLTADQTNLEIRGSSQPIKFNFDLLQFDNMKFDGLVPVIINISPVINLPLFLSENTSSAEKSS